MSNSGVCCNVTCLVSIRSGTTHLWEGKFVTHRMLSKYEPKLRKNCSLMFNALPCVDRTLRHHNLSSSSAMSTISQFKSRNFKYVCINSLKNDFPCLSKHFCRFHAVFSLKTYWVSVHTPLSSPTRSRGLLPVGFLLEFGLGPKDINVLKLLRSEF